jgi:hypothetical protein
MSWQRRGVYFFMEAGEGRRESGAGTRIVRVGTHALKENGSTLLWTRLAQHRGGLATGSGNHRGSIFRVIVGSALIAQRGYDYPSWGNGNNAARDIRAGERELECEVSGVICAMPVLWRLSTFNRMVADMYERGKALNTASLFELDDVIDPADTRKWILAGLRTVPSPALRTGKKRPFVDGW